MILRVMLGYFWGCVSRVLPVARQEIACSKCLGPLSCLTSTLYSHALAHSFLRHSTQEMTRLLDKQVKTIEGDVAALKKQRIKLERDVKEEEENLTQLIKALQQAS